MRPIVYGGEDRIFAQSRTRHALVLVGKGTMLQTLASRAKEAGFDEIVEARDINELQCRFPSTQKGFVLCELDDGIEDIRAQQLCASAMDMARVANFGFGIAGASRVPLEGKLAFAEPDKRKNAIDIVFLHATETMVGFRNAMRLRFPAAHEHIHVVSNLVEDSLFLMRQVFGLALTKKGGA